MAGRLSLLVLLLSFSLGKAQAQQANIIDHLAQYDMGWTAFHPYLMEFSFSPFYQAGIRHDAQSGSFRPAFRDDKYTDLGFHSISQKAIRDWRLQGSFSYRKVLNQRKPYLLQKRTEPHLPFTLADNRLESWGGDHIDFSLAGLSPIYLNRFRSYALVRYEVSSGNRNAEPRPLYRHSDLHVEIGNQISISQNFRFGVAGSFGQALEENNVGAYAVQDFSLYQLRGISTFTRNTFQSFQRHQQENTFSGKAFLSYSRNQDWGFVEITSSAGQYEARDGIAFPLDAGRVESSALKINTGFNKSFSNGRILQFSGGFLSHSSFATDPVFRAINYDFSRNIINAQTAITFPGDILRRLAIDTKLMGEKREETAGRDLLDFQNLESQLASDLVLPLSKDRAFWFRPALGYRSNLRHTASSQSPGLTKEIFDLEKNYYTSNALLASMKATWLMPLKENHLSMSLDLATERTADQQYIRFSLEIGLLF